ncbi:MAG: hypothetical protein KC563_02010, partial [Nitrospira sp.]|nr:hypothetical protein [Nitrospira sp.]
GHLLWLVLSPPRSSHGSPLEKDAGESQHDSPTFQSPIFSLRLPFRPGWNGGLRPLFVDVPSQLGCLAPGPSPFQSAKW